MPQTVYASWGRRVPAFLIDFLPAIIAALFFCVGYLRLLFSLYDQIVAGRDPLDYSAGRWWLIAAGILFLVSLVWLIFNRWRRAGRTGQSWGRRLMNIRLVSDQTWQSIGAFNAFVRDLVHILDCIALLGFLWPLWDNKRQTFADIIMRTIVVIPLRGSMPPGATWRCR
jgi:uncharacterized RDD family membrane protein YckC